MTTKGKKIIMDIGNILIIISGIFMVFLKSYLIGVIFLSVGIIKFIWDYKK